jgi:hypothetical protein
MRKLLTPALADLSTGQLATLETLSPSPTGGATGSYDQIPRPPAEIEADDVLWEGPAIHAYVTELIGHEQSLSATYYWIKKGWIPTTKVAGHLIGSKPTLRRQYRTRSVGF